MRERAIETVFSQLLDNVLRNVSHTFRYILAGATPVRWQSRDRKLVAKDGAVDEMFLIYPDLAKGARIVWPADD